MLLLALLAFLPVAPSVAPVPPRAPGLQASARPDFRALRARWGGAWFARWDGATPRFLAVPSVPTDLSDPLVADIAALGGVPASELDLVDVVQRGTRELRRYERTWRGAPVEGDHIGLVAERGRVFAAWVQLSPLGGLDGEPRPDELVLARPKPALVTREASDRWVRYLDRAGREVHGYDPRRFGTIEHSYEERTAGDALLVGPARRVTVTDGTGVEQTDDAGAHTRTGSVEVWLDGGTLAVLDNGAELRVTTSETDVLDADTDLPYAASDVLHHFYVAWDWLTLRWPTHAWLGERVRATVRAAGTCNAYYTGGTVTFYRETSGSCNDLGRVSDVVYHELGHGFHDYILAMGTFASDVSEGSADFVSATIWDDPVVGLDAWGAGTYVRELDTDRVYPTDYVGESHNDGLIWGSFLWNLREQWSAAYGTTDGVEATDLLFLGALEQGPTLTDLYEAVLVADEDDGDWSNGTPHACELKDLLDAHGLGPGPIGVVTFDHEPLGPQPSDADGYEVTFELYDLTPDCSGLDPSSVAVWYTTGGETAPGIDGADYTGWTRLAPVASGSTWTATIPRAPATTEVRYFIEATSTDGTETLTTYDDDDDVYAFWVGDREALWCDGFESGASTWRSGTGVYGTRSSTGTNEWVVGAPVGGATWDPDAAYAGTSVLTTVLDGDYVADNAEWIQAPTVTTAGDERMLLLGYERWLTVEDATYDVARLMVNGAEVWRNPETRRGDTHLLDLGWTHVDVEAADLVASDGTLQLGFTLTSDAGLEFGGWALDDVCVYALADVAGHYRVDDLEASGDGATVIVTWTDPWVTPLTEVRLVRRFDAPPTGPEDGDVLDADLAPEPGRERLYVDTDLAPGESAWYAVFASDGTWHEDVVEGENLDAGGVPAEGGGDTGVGETGAPADTGSPSIGETADTASGADTSPRETAIGETSLPDTGPADTGAGDTAVGDTSPADTASGGETSHGDTAGADTSDRDTSSRDTSGSDTSDSDTSGTDTSDSDTSGSDTSDSDTSPSDTSVTDTSVTDTSVTDTSITDTEVTDTSVTDTSVTDASVTDTSPPDDSSGDTDTEDPLPTDDADSPPPSAEPPGGCGCGGGGAPSAAALLLAAALARRRR